MSLGTRKRRKMRSEVNRWGQARVSFRRMTQMSDLGPPLCLTKTSTQYFSLQLIIDSKNSSSLFFILCTASAPRILLLFMECFIRRQVQAAGHSQLPRNLEASGEVCDTST
jgi:hypothetical protein